MKIKLLLILILMGTHAISLAQTNEVDSSTYNIKPGPLKKEYKSLKSLPAEQNLEAIYERASFFREMGDEYYNKKMLDSAQVYYAKSAFIKNPSKGLDILDALKMIEKDQEAFDEFQNNQDSVNLFIEKAKNLAELISGNKEMSEQTNSLSKAVVMIENFAYRNAHVDMSIKSNISDKMEVQMIRWGKQNYLPWTTIYTDTVLRVSRARYKIKYKVGEREIVKDFSCSAGCNIIINEP